MLVRSARYPLFPPVCTPFRFSSRSMSLSVKPWKPTLSVSQYPSSSRSSFDFAFPGRNGNDSFECSPRGSRLADRWPLTWYARMRCAMPSESDGSVAW